MSANSIFFEEGELSRDEEKMFAREELRYNVAEDILLVLEEKGLTQSDLARALGKTKGFVSQLLNRNRNMTINTLSDVAFELGLDVKVSIRAPERPWRPQDVSLDEFLRVSGDRREIRSVSSSGGGQWVDEVA